MTSPTLHLLTVSLCATVLADACSAEEQWLAYGVSESPYSITVSPSDRRRWPTISLPAA